MRLEDREFWDEQVRLDEDDAMNTLRGGLNPARDSYRPESDHGRASEYPKLERFVAASKCLHASARNPQPSSFCLNFGDAVHTAYVACLADTSGTNARSAPPPRSSDSRFHSTEMTLRSRNDAPPSYEPTLLEQFESQLDNLVRAHWLYQHTVYASLPPNIEVEARRWEKEVEDLAAKLENMGRESATYELYAVVESLEASRSRYDRSRIMSKEEFDCDNGGDPEIQLDFERKLSSDGESPAGQEDAPLERRLGLGTKAWESLQPGRGSSHY